MEREHRFIAPLSQCHYLPDQQWQLEYRVKPALTQVAYGDLVRQGWRRFGGYLFRPQCPACTACRPIRVVVEKFEPDRSQRRVIKANSNTTLSIGEPVIDDERLELYHLHHAHHAEQKGWPFPTPDSGFDHIANLADGPIRVQEFSYRVDGKLVAISYIDDVGDGFSGVYFYHHPDYRHLSLGNWICLSLIKQAAVQQKPYVYLGYFIKNCRSMEYKGRFGPNEVLVNGERWEPFVF